VKTAHIDATLVTQLWDFIKSCQDLNLWKVS